MQDINNYLNAINENPDVIKNNEWIITFLAVVFLTFSNSENKLDKEKLIEILNKIDTDNKDNLINLLNKEE